MNPYQIQLTKRTAIHRKKLTRPLTWLWINEHFSNLHNKRVLDYGSGKSVDYIFLGADRYDPNFQPIRPKHKYDIILCTYVLNVLQKDEQDKVMEDIKSLLKVNGRAYITVRRDIKFKGVKVKGYYTKGGWSQTRVELDLPKLKETSNFCTYLLYK